MRHHNETFVLVGISLLAQDPPRATIEISLVQNQSLADKIQYLQDQIATGALTLADLYLTTGEIQQNLQEPWMTAPLPSPTLDEVLPGRWRLVSYPGAGSWNDDVDNPYICGLFDSPGSQGSTTITAVIQAGDPGETMLKIQWVTEIAHPPPNP